MPRYPVAAPSHKKAPSAGGEMRLGLTRGRGPLRRGLKGSPDSIRDSAAAAVALQCRQSGLMAGATSVSADRSSFDGLRHPNPAFPTAIRPQVSKAARSWSVARQVHRPPAVRAGGSCCDVVANRPHQTLYRNMIYLTPCIANMIYLTAVRFQTTDLNSNACLRQ